MIKISKDKWNKISKDYKGEWDKNIVNYHKLPNEFIGKKTVLEGCLIKETSTRLLTEGIHFIIE